MSSNIPQKIVSQRIRNRNIEYFELASDENELIEYQKKVPYINVLTEFINQWEDFFCIDGVSKGWYVNPTYTDEEVATLISFHKVWDRIFSELPESIDNIQDYLSSKWWPPIKESASRSLAIFLKRGKLSEDEIKT